MGSVGNGQAGRTFIGTGVTSSPTFAPIGTLSGFTQFGVVLGGGAGPFTFTNAGTSGDVLTSNGIGIAPSYQPLSGTVPLQFTGDNGTIAIPAGNNITIFAGNVSETSGSSVSFQNSGSTSTLHLEDVRANIFLGAGAGNVALTTASNNVSVGGTALTAITSGIDNVSIGYASMFSNTSGNLNTAVGFEALIGLVSGTNNIALGDGAGSSYTGAESSNICIGETGTLADANTIRLGTQGAFAGAQDKCFIAGIIGVTASNPVLVTTNSSTTQMGVVASGNNGVLISSALGVPSFLANGTTGQVLTATTGSPPSWGAGASGTVTSVSGGPGITITGTATDPIVNSVIFTDTTAATLAVDNGYFATAAGTYPMPATAAQGEEIIVVCDTAGAVVLDCPALNFIRIGNAITSSGGTVTSTAIGDSLTLRYRLSTLTWYAAGVQGNWIIA